MRSYYCGLLMLMWTAAALTAAPIISIQPTSATAVVGESVTANVRISDVIELFGFQFDVVFDASLLAATNVTEGGFFASNGVFFSEGAIDNTAGTISFIADVLAGLGPGFSGSETLVAVQFEALAVGVASIDLANVILLESSLGDITATTGGGSVTIITPEPGAIGLVGIGLLGVVWAGRRGARAPLKPMGLVVRVHARPPGLAK